MISCYKLTGMELEQVAEVLAIPYLEITYRVCLFVCVCVCACMCGHLLSEFQVSEHTICMDS